MSRFSRQVVMPEVGPEGQAKLTHARVLIVGVGGLGCPAAAYLAAAGVGRIGLVDPDRVSLENLHRQLLYREGDIGRYKVDIAAAALNSIAPGTVIDTHAGALTGANATELIGNYDIVLDGTDRFTARYAVNEGARKTGRPNVFAAIHGFMGQLSVFSPEGPCYACVFPNPPAEGAVPSCAEAGVLGALPGLMGTWQALEALKLILGVGRPLIGRMMLFDGLSGETRLLEASSREDCPVCAGRSVAAPQHAVVSSFIEEIDARALSAELNSKYPPKLLDVREDAELAISKLKFDYHIPVGELLDRVDELSLGDDLVVYCRSGARSASAAAFLAKRGFKRVRNLKGGIIAWAHEVDSTLTVY